jgi:cysteine desulfuration protein SufE
MFREAPEDLIVPALLDHARRLPELPDGLTAEDMEQVVECQSPFFFAVELGDDGVRAHFTVPEEAPSTRGFASVLAEGIEGASAEEVLAIPDDLYRHLRLDAVVTEQRLGGMEAVVRRLKRQVAALAAA